MASYLEQYNTPAVNPFKTDYEGMLRGIQTKESYWKQGVQRVKSAYEQAAGLSLTGKIAKERLQGFMTNADKELKKALASDVSIADNAANAINIYKPLYQDQEIIGNHNITEHYKSQFDTINSFRTKDGGKEYNDVNARDVMNSYADFAKGVDEGRSASEFEGTKRSYTPYVDVTEQSLDILKKCPKDSKSDMGIGEDPLTFKTIEDNSLTASKLAGCLNAALDSKYKNQLLVNQRVNFHNNPQALGQTWLNIANEDIADLTKKYQLAKANASFSIKEPEKNKYFNDYATNLESQIKEKQKAVGNIVKGDYRDVQNNFDQYAYQVGVYSHVQNFAGSFNSINTKTEYSPYVGNMQRVKQSFEREQNYINNNFEMTKQDAKFKQDQILSQQNSDEAIKLQYFKDTGTILDPNGLAKIKANGGVSAFNDQTVSKITDADEQIRNGVDYLKDIKQTEENNNTGILQATTDLKNSETLKKDEDALTTLAAIGIDFKNPSYITEANVNNLENIIETYQKNPANSTLDSGSINELNKYLQRVKPLVENNKLIQTENSFYRAGVDKLVGKFETDLNNKLAKEVISFNLPNGIKTKITGRDLKELITDGKSGDFKYSNTSNSGNNSTFTMGTTGNSSSGNFYYKGQLIDTYYGHSQSGIHPLIDKRNDIIDQNNKLLNQIKSAQNQVYGQAFANSKVYYSERMLKDEKLAKSMDEATKTKLNLQNLNTDNKKISEYTVKGYGANDDIYVNVSEKLYKDNKGKNNIVGYKDEQGYMLVIPVAKGIVPQSGTPSELKENQRIPQLQKAFENYAPADNKPHQLADTKTNKGVKVRIVGTKTSAGPSYAIELYNSTTGKYDQNTKDPAMYNNPDFVAVYEQYINYKNNY